MVKLLGKIGLVLLMALPLSATASWDEASVIVEQTTNNMLQVMADQKAQLANQEEPADAEVVSVEEQERARVDEAIEAIDGVLSDVVDFPYISKRVMGKYYRRASAEDRDRFSGIFKTTLLKTYAKALLTFEIERYELVKPKKSSSKPDKQVVTVEVFSANGQKYSLVYYMLKREGKWSLVNAMVDGINLRLTFKNQFADMAQRAKGNVSQVVSDWGNQVDGTVKAEKEAS